MKTDLPLEAWTDADSLCQVITEAQRRLEALMMTTVPLRHPAVKKIEKFGQLIAQLKCHLENVMLEQRHSLDMPCDFFAGPNPESIARGTALLLKTPQYNPPMCGNEEMTR